MAHAPAGRPWAAHKAVVAAAGDAQVQRATAKAVAAVPAGGPQAAHKADVGVGRDAGVPRAVDKVGAAASRHEQAALTDQLRGTGLVEV